MSVENSEPSETRVFIVASDVRFRVVSDVDDTVMVTALPRPLLAAWNSFVVDEHARQPVPGMARSEEHTSELQSLMRNSYAVFRLSKQKNIDNNHRTMPH